MSYDLYMFERTSVGCIITSPSELLEKIDEIEPGPLDPAKEARKREVADALLRADPDLEVFELDYVEIARFENISIDEAKTRFRYLELNSKDEGLGIQVTLRDDCATLTLPYVHSGESASPVFARIWKYLKVIQSFAGYQVYDPQMERFVDLESDLEKVTTNYTLLVERFL